MTIRKCCTVIVNFRMVGKQEVIRLFLVARDPPGISHCPMVKDIDTITAAWLNPGFVFYKHP